MIEEVRTFRYRLTLGDWAGEGHRAKETYVFRSNKPMDEVREAYFAAKERLPAAMCPENFMNGDDDYQLPRVAYQEALNRGYDFFPELCTEDVTDEVLEDGSVSDYDLFRYTLWFIQQGDPDLKLNSEYFEEFMFYGFDKKGRHIGTIGYGCFE